MPNKRKPRPQTTCRCDAYPFPHRLYGGQCYGPDDEEEEDDPGARIDAAYEAWRDRNLFAD